MLTDCAGCEASNPGTPVTQSNSIGYSSTTISVWVYSGTCAGMPPVCGATPCEVDVVRSWTLGPDKPIDFCVTAAGSPKTCQKPQPTSGSTGAGSDTQSDYIRCGGTKTYSIEVPGTPALTSAVTGSCSACE